MKAIFVLGILLAATCMTLSQETCRRYDVNGCSTPFHMPFFYKRRFTHACNRHDVCYRCGHHFGIPRDVCDSDFLETMTQSCQSLRKRRSTEDVGGHVGKRSLGRHMCELIARGYYTVVKEFGASEYRIPSKPFCGEMWWVLSCLPQRYL